MMVKFYHRYLNYRSHHPVDVKRGVIKSLYDRATRVTMHEEDLVKERMHLKKVFVNNDYPEAFLSATLNPVAPKPREVFKIIVIGKKDKNK